MTLNRGQKYSIVGIHYGAEEALVAKGIIDDYNKSTVRF